MNYPIKKNYISYNRSYQALTPVGMVVHGTDTPGATDENESTYFNTGYRAASAHAFIDWDSITETVPTNEVAWGSGNTSNHKFLQVELCQPATHDTAKFQEVWNRAVFYFAYNFINIIKCTNISIDNLLSHAEVSARWHETDHTDPVAYFAEYGKTMDDFRTAVQQEINNQTEVFDMDNIVLYLGDGDVFAALIVSQKLGCPLMRKEDFEAKGLKCKNAPVVIGGKPGSTRFTTFKDAAALLG